MNLGVDGDRRRLRLVNVDPGSDFLQEGRRT